MTSASSPWPTCATSPSCGTTRGRITGLPQVEHLLDACLDSLRSARSADRELARLDWNRIQLYVWPAVDAPLGELTRSSGRWRPAPGRWAWTRCWCSSATARPAS